MVTVQNHTAQRFLRLSILQVMQRLSRPCSNSGISIFTGSHQRINDVSAARGHDGELPYQ
jgi:hypothetical protein